MSTIKCNKCGICCLCATPSVSYRVLLEKAAKGEQFARDFFSIFVPYKNPDEARNVCKAIVDRVMENCRTGRNNIPLEELVFYRCQYYDSEKKCTIYSERPELCRDFPGSPHVILHRDCAFYEWAEKEKQNYKKLKEELEKLQKQKKELVNLKHQNNYICLLSRLKTLNDENYRFMITVPSMCVVSPWSSWLK